MGWPARRMTLRQRGRESGRDDGVVVLDAVVVVVVVGGGVVCVAAGRVSSGGQAGNGCSSRVPRQDMISRCRQWLSALCEWCKRGRICAGHSERLVVIKKRMGMRADRVTFARLDSRHGWYLLLLLVPSAARYAARESSRPCFARDRPRRQRRPPGVVQACPFLPWEHCGTVGRWESGHVRVGIGMCCIPACATSPC